MQTAVLEVSVSLSYLLERCLITEERLYHHTVQKPCQADIIVKQLQERFLRLL